MEGAQQQDATRLLAYPLDGPWYPTLLALSSTSYPSGVNSTPCNNSIQLEQVIHRYPLPTLFLSGGHLHPPHSIRARGVQRRSGHNGRYDLLRQQIEGLYVGSRDAAHEILEAYVDQRLYPLDSVARRGRQHGLLQEGQERRRELIQLRLGCCPGLGQHQHAELHRAEDRPVGTASLLTALLQDLELVTGIIWCVGPPAQLAAAMFDTSAYCAA